MLHATHREEISVIPPQHQCDHKRFSHRHRRVGAAAAVMVAAPVTASADNGPHAGTDTVTNRDGNQEQFTIGGDNGCTVYHRWASSGGVIPSGGWSSMGGCVFAGYGLDVGMNPNGRLEVFAIGTDHAVWHEWQTVAGSGPWSDWASLGGYATSGPSVVSCPVSTILPRTAVCSAFP